MENNKEQLQQSHQGTGSAEQTGRDRDEQRLESRSLSEKEKSDTASQIGEKSSRISSIEELGGLSGRDDASGGSGDRMEEASSNDRTDKF